MAGARITSDPLATKLKIKISYTFTEPWRLRAAGCVCLPKTLLIKLLYVKPVLFKPNHKTNHSSRASAVGRPESLL